MTKVPYQLLDISKTDLGLGSVDNTSDANKPVSNATQQALNDKAPLDSPAFTGTPTVPNQPLSNYNAQAISSKFLSDAFWARFEGLTVDGLVGVTTSNIDEIDNNSIYAIYVNGSTPAGTLTGLANGWYYLQTWIHDDPNGYKVQTALSYNVAGGVYMRNLVSGVWTPWVSTTIRNAESWVLEEESGVLKFKKNGVTKASLDGSGNFKCTGDVTAFSVL